MHDVLVLGHRPVRTDAALRTKMDRGFLPQPLEIGPNRIRTKQLRPADVDILEPQGMGLESRAVIWFVGAVHGATALGVLGGNQAANREVASDSETGWSSRSLAVTASSQRSSSKTKGSALPSLWSSTRRASSRRRASPPRWPNSAPSAARRAALAAW